MAVLDTYIMSEWLERLLELSSGLITQLCKKEGTS